MAVIGETAEETILWPFVCEAVLAPDRAIKFAEFLGIDLAKVVSGEETFSGAVLAHYRAVGGVYRIGRAEDDVGRWKRRCWRPDRADA